MYVRPNHKLYNQTPVISQNLKTVNKQQQQKHFCTPPATFLFHIKGGNTKSNKKELTLLKISYSMNNLLFNNYHKINELGFACHKHHLNWMQTEEKCLFYL